MADIHRMPGRAGEPELGPRLGAAVAALRDEPSVGSAWRQALLARVASDEPAPAAGRGEQARARARRWPSWLTGVAAAGLGGLLVGAGATYAVLQRHLALGVARAPAVARAAPAVRTLPVRFTLVAPNAAHVALVGDLNGWNPRALPMRRLADGHTWEVQVSLPPGRYAYAFVVDGRLARDPSAPEGGGDDYGTANSILLVPAPAAARDRIVHGAGL